MAVTTPLIASLSVLGLLLGGGAAALTLDDQEPAKSDQDCRKSADEWACHEDRVREACKDQQVKPREPSDDAPPSRTVQPKESDECRQAYEEAIAEYCADHPDDPRCAEYRCAKDGPSTASTDEYPSECQSACSSSKESSSSDDRPKCATAEEPKKETRPPLLPGVPIVE